MEYKYTTLINNYDDLVQLSGEIEHTFDQVSSLVYKFIDLGLKLEKIESDKKINKPEYHYLKCKILKEIFILGGEILKNNETEEAFYFKINLQILKETTLDYFQDYPDNQFYQELTNFMDL